MLQELEIQTLPFTTELDRAYRLYAAETIEDRALPDVRDGCKPVQRRILYAMYDMGLKSDRPYRKCARIVGDTLGKYHPHGDQSVYGSLVRLAQDFSLRYPLVDGQGNFGSVDGDNAAAMRYCVSGDTLVVTDQGLVPISRLSNGREDVRLQVLSAGGKVNAAHKWFDSGEHPTLRVRTWHGYEVTGTYNHPLLTWQVGPDGRPTFAWKTLDTIVPGDWLVLDRTPDTLWPSELVDLRCYYPAPLPGSRVENHVLPEKLDETLAFLLGALAAEGSVNDQRIEFDNLPGEFADRFRKAWQAVFPTCRLHEFLKAPSSFGQQPQLQFQVVATQVRLFLEQLGFEWLRAAERTVPEIVLRSPQNVVAAFLRAYFEGDGAVEQSGRSLLLVSACSSSRKLLQQVQVLLLRFGIVSWLRPDRPGTYKLSIRNRENVARFAQSIGFVSERKRTALQSILLRLSEALELADSAWIGSLSQTHYLFDQVTEIAEAGLQRVYSLRVESPCHSFCANGFINHNTEARLSSLGELMLQDIESDTVDFTENFDGSLKEPTVLPAAFPNLLVNGASGIAVGMATNIPPHNLGEIADAIVHVVQNWARRDNITTDELMKFVLGPDFPTGGIIYRYREVNGEVKDTIRAAYDEGRGQIVTQARMHVEDIGGGKANIVITEIPFNVQKITLLERIAREVKDGRIGGITDLRDESDFEQGMRVVVEVSRTAKTRDVMADLLKYSQLQETFGCNNLALVPDPDRGGVRPQRLSLRQMLAHFIDFRLQVIERRTRYELKRREERLHIVEGLLKALGDIDEVVDIIKRSRQPETARTNLMRKLGLTEVQAQAILDMPLRRLTSLEISKLRDEEKELKARIKYLQGLLRSQKKRLEVVIEETRALKEKFATPRRTVILDSEDAVAGAAVTESELRVPETPQVVLVTTAGIERRDASGFRYAPADGITSRATTSQLIQVRAEPTDEVILVSNTGRAWRNGVGFVPEKASFTDIGLKKDERVVGVAVLPKDSAYLVAGTRAGRIKRTRVEDLSLSNGNWATVVGLPDEADEVLFADVTRDGAEVLFATRGGQVLRTSADEVNPQASGSARGVAGIGLKKGDQPISGAVIPADEVDRAWVFVVTEKGFAKRVPLKEYSRQGRGTQGVLTLNVTRATGKVAAVAVGTLDEGLDVIFEDGKRQHLAAEKVPAGNRYTRGEPLIKVQEAGGPITMAVVI